MRANTEAKERERRGKISEASRQHWQDPEYRDKVILKLKLPRPNSRGRPAWNKGIPWTEESRHKMSESAKRRGCIPEAHSPQARAKRSESLSKIFSQKWQEDESYRSRNLMHLENLNKSPEHRISSAKGARKVQELYPEIIQAFLEKGWNYMKSPEGRQFLRNKAIMQWQVMRVELIKAQRRGTSRPNKKEAILQAMLNEDFPNEWMYSGNGEHVPDKVLLAGLVPDFIAKDGRRAVIELFGDYWHKGESEENKRGKYSELGYQCLVIWEHELDWGIKHINDKVRKFSNG